MSEHEIGAGAHLSAAARLSSPKSAQAGDGHPDLAEIEAARTGEAGAETTRHVESCARCRGTLGELRELGELARGLVAAEPAIEVPAEVDGAIRAAARERAAEIVGAARHKRILYLSWPGWAAAAAVLVAAGLFLARGTSPRGPRDAMDVDGSGAVDIVDAYLMSRRVASRGRAPSAWDFDKDGAVGASDVDAVAVRAVALADGGI